MTEEFRYPEGAGLLLKLGGGGFVGFAVAFVTHTILANNLDGMVIGASTFAAVVGVIMIGTGIVRDRFVLRIGSEGVQFGSTAEPLPWETLATLGFPRFRNELLVLGRAGELLGTIPGSLEHFDRAVIRLAERMPLKPPGNPSTRFGGTFGIAGWIVLAMVVLELSRIIDPSRLSEMSRSATIFVVLILAMWAWKARYFWGRTGRTQISVDSWGIRFAGRAGVWESTWAELAELRPQFLGVGLGAHFGLVATKSDGSWQALPLDNTDLNGLLGAIRTYGGVHWGRSFVPPAEPPDSPLLGRKR